MAVLYDCDWCDKEISFVDTWTVHLSGGVGVVTDTICADCASRMRQVRDAIIHEREAQAR